MRSERLENREQAILDKLRQRPRLEGQHITEAIYCNVKAWGLARLSAVAEIPPTPFDDASLLRMLIGTGMGQVLEEGHVSQIETVAADSQDVGTVDIWLRDHPVEIKVTYLSTSREITRQEHWLEQLGEYVYRAMNPKRATPYGELWIVHLLGDHGKKRCAEHGVPVYAEGEKPLKLRWPETNGWRLACPQCGEFLEDGDRNTTLRCYRIEWTWDELQTLHESHRGRQEQLQADILNTDYQPGNPPPVRWGYAFECGGCPVKERIGCPGMDAHDLEAELAGSILELQEAKA